jgi:thiamine-phosphate pyrophosphorylase
MGKDGLFDLLLITDEAPGLCERVTRALERAPRGRVAVQLRHKSLPADALLELARELRAITHAAGAPLLVNDRVDVALAIDADGIHLPERGLPGDVARALLPAGRVVGRSCHDAYGLERAAREGADYATLAPVFTVPGKGRPLGVPAFGRLCRQASIPVFALGGITAAHTSELRVAGARGVAVMRSVLGTADPATQLEGLLAQL